MNSGFPIGRRDCLAGLALTSLLPVGAAAQNRLQKIRFGLPAPAIQPVHIDLLIPETLGYFRQEGLAVDVVPLGSYATAFANLNSGRLEFVLNVSSFDLPMRAKGELLGTLNFMESTYPFRYGMAVKRGSSLKSLADLKGKRIGDSGPGFASHMVAETVLKIAGLSPEKDVSWLTVGDGLTGGIALQRGDIDGLFYGDNGFAPIEAAGIPLTYLPLPSSVPQVGGIYFATTKQLLKDHRSWAVGLGRAVTKAHVFIRENPEAASYLLGQIAPNLMPKAMDLKDQIKALMVPVTKRMAYYVPHDKSVALQGASNDKQWNDEAAAANLTGKIGPLSAIYMNDLINDINAFDVAKVRNDARLFALPYKAK